MITFEQIAKANEQIKTTDIKGKNYAEVNQRIKAFRMVFPNGSIITDIVGYEDGVVTMKATVRDDEGKIIGSGLAQEKETSSFINKTSFIENCETSAWGRALGNLGIGIDTSIASAEEVINAVNNQPKPKLNDSSIYISLAKLTDLDLIKNFYEENKDKVNDPELLRKRAREQYKAISDAKKAFEEVTA
jgi:hypothetical protein